ncbi:MAG: hypothetical protein HXY50_09595 [Ignavibacteriaceae bacterium]|nr:hypothetical protein [Ignavibacteriaceae bacterium]
MNHHIIFSINSDSLTLMFSNRSLILFVSLLFLIAAFLKIVGIIRTDYIEIASFVLIVLGIGVVYSSMGKGGKKLLVGGVIAFLVGIELFITHNYEFSKLSNIVLPSIFFILGTAFLVLFIDDLSNKLLLIISLIFLSAGLYFFNKLGSLNISAFLNSVLSITINYWPVLIIFTVILMLLNKKNKG